MTRTHSQPGCETDPDVSPGGESWISPDDCPTWVDREALYQQFRPLVNSLLRRYGKTPELKQDLSGEIYYRFCRLVEAYDPSRGIPICAYVARMLSQSVFNYVRDYWRGESRLVQLPDEHQLEETIGAVATPAYEDSLIAEELRSALPAAIARLPHRQRLVVVWRYYDNRSFEEIAEELQVKPATVRSLLRHGIAALRIRFREISR